ncbi:uncharacterized protein MELLADRAFT_103084 [Melampsora larici-populina 98AG31]|uniref:Uncharacterized protein n=1 Tax=Melampsora larici-populina (strain 98AG31 / pathotype 3-4-7) TaxID=747676 RepID=F4RAH8_MELLP|nr:uncharacterized protein MELLADRAFT_103084 [Melampsora larici-populina 98AG31]EGG10777.1 hypothetical protein MELLADRAFT_103084 [Melampsora larici-populina 98AG31]
MADNVESRVFGDQIQNYHNRISEDKLEAVTKALYSCQIAKTDSLTSFVDKFENLIREFYRLKGELSDIQSARMLMGAIPSLSIETKEYNNNTVVPLTREGVGSYLRKYEERHGWTCAAIREVNAVSVRPAKKVSGECSPDECVGPHLAKNWKSGGSSPGPSSSQPTSSSSVKGVKKVFDASVNNASASMAFLSLNVEFVDEEPKDPEISQMSQVVCVAVVNPEVYIPSSGYHSSTSRF